MGFKMATAEALNHSERFETAFAQKAIEEI
jgi:hypothetical protein